MTTWTMTEARRRFRELLERAGSGRATQITRRGRLAAVVVAPHDFERLQAGTVTFAEALRRFRTTADTTDLVGDELEGLRDRSPGRSVDL